MSWTPRNLLPDEHCTFGGQYVELLDQDMELGDGHREITLSHGHGAGSTLVLHVEHDAELIAHIAEGLLKVLGDVRQIKVSARLAAAKAALEAEVAA